ncbi:MAG: hypothetical protein ACFFBH_17020 [Promethearchaeota archaeon]
MKNRHFRILIITLFIIPIILFNTNPISIIPYSSNDQIQEDSLKFKIETPHLSFPDVWSPNGTAICTADNYQGYVQICSDGEGGAIITWEDHRRGGYSDIYAQRVDSSGNIMWKPNGVSIYNSTYYTYPQICSDGNGGAIISWQQFIVAGNTNIYAQKVDSNGSLSWRTLKTKCAVICTAPDNQDYLQICSDGDGGAIITWRDLRRGGADWDIYAQRVDINGTNKWIKDGVEICTGIDYRWDPQICSDGEGGAIITWEDDRRRPGQDIYVQRVDANGTTRWISNGKVISPEISYHYNPQICSDGAGGAIITWDDGRNEFHRDIYAQRVDADGTTQWIPNGTAICSEAFHQRNPQICSDGGGGAIITWEDQRPDQYSDKDIYTQRIDFNGNTLWIPNGTAICTVDNDQIAPQICSDGVEGIIITWQDYRSGSDWDIYAQKISSNGISQWTPDGLAICNFVKNQDVPQICSDGIGGSIITWRDNRSVFDIYAQRTKNHPLITIKLPTTYHLFERTAPSFNIEVIELNIATMWYTIDGGVTNKTFTELIGEINQAEWSKKGNGTITIEFYIEDIFGLIDSAEVTVHKDIEAPDIKISHPGLDQEFGETVPSFIISITEGNLDKIWYTIDGGITNVTITELSGKIDQTIWDGISQGSVIIKFYANDTLGHIGSEEISVIKSVSGAKGNFWDDLLQQGILIPVVGGIAGGVVGITFFFIKRKIRKKDEKVDT